MNILRRRKWKMRIYICNAAKKFRYELCRRFSRLNFPRWKLFGWKIRVRLRVCFTLINSFSYIFMYGNISGNVVLFFIIFFKDVIYARKYFADSPRNIYFFSTLHRCPPTRLRSYLFHFQTPPHWKKNSRLTNEKYKTHPRPPKSQPYSKNSARGDAKLGISTAGWPC